MLILKDLPPKECATNMMLRPCWFAISRTPPKGVEKLTQFNLRSFNACSRFLACALMLLWFAGPLKKCETIESYPHVRIREFLQSSGRRSSGQKTPSAPSLCEPLVPCLCLDVREKRFLMVRCEVPTPPPEPCGPVLEIFSQVHVRRGWPCRPWTNMML